MASTDEIPEIDSRGLRRFALVGAGACAVLLGLLAPWILDRTYPLWPWIAAAVLAVWGVAAPESLRPMYRAWMLFGLAMHRVTTPAVLTVVFFLVITPTALATRVFRRDALGLRIDHGASSYREPSPTPGPNHIERPF